MLGKEIDQEHHGYVAQYFMWVSRLVKECFRREGLTVIVEDICKSTWKNVGCSDVHTTCSECSYRLRDGSNNLKHTRVAAKEKAWEVWESSTTALRL